MLAGEPQIGWFMLSEADRSAANRFLTKLASDETRDELGFAPIHFAFADRFFPGTSVQHAELRYVFFIAWTYEELLRQSAGKPFPMEALKEIEARYANRLMRTIGYDNLRNSGISGWMKYRADEKPIVRASTIYWSALRAWAMADAVAGLRESPTESQLRGLWPSLARLEGDDGRSVTAPLFKDLPPAPRGWGNKTGKLEFALERAEQLYLRRKWAAAGQGPEPPLLSKLTEAGVKAQSLWSSDVRKVASAPECENLVLAEQAASLVCIARAVHAALIEGRRNVELGVDETTHEEALPRLIGEHRDKALALDVAALRRETGIDRRLATFIEVIQDWLRVERGLSAIADTVAERERDLKHNLAYMVSPERRKRWDKRVATPLDYRWPTVRSMIDRVLAPA